MMGDVRVHSNGFGPAASTITLQQKVETKHQAATAQLQECLSSAVFMSFDYGELQLSALILSFFNE